MNTSKLFLLLTAALFVAQGCASDGSDDGTNGDNIVIDAEAGDFEGCWVGEVTYQQVGSAQSESVEMTFEISETTDGASVVMSDEMETFDPIDGEVADGALTYLWPVSEPENPDCADWDLTATLQLNNDGDVVMSAAGEACSDEEMEASGVLQSTTCS